MRNLVLASTSPHRRELLARLGLTFVTDTPQVREDLHDGESLAEATLRLAGSKARACAGRHPDALVIGCDQLCALDGRISGKPVTRGKAISQLLRASGRIVEFRTALVLLDTRTGQTRQHVASNAVRFRRLRRGQIEDYVDREQPLACAGAFMCEGLGIALFERISGDDPTALIGLPLIALCSLLHSAGLPVLGSGLDQRS